MAFSVNMILEKVFCADLPEGYAIADENKKSKFLVVPGNDGPRWIVPSNPRLGFKTLKQWMPYEMLSRIKWSLLLSLYRFGFMGKIPGVSSTYGSGGIRGKSDLMGVKPSDKSLIYVVPIVYVGTLSPQQKLVVTLVDESNGESLVVVKIPLAPEARKSIATEASILLKLADLNVNNTPRLVSIDNASGVSIQTVIDGNLASRRLNKTQVDFLLTLPSLDKVTTIAEQKKFIEKTIKDNSGLFKEFSGFFCMALSSLDEDYVIPQVLVHGDFAPWNIKQCKNGSCSVIDWEDASFCGLPLWDLCHFYFIQAHLFNQPELMNKFISTPLIKYYLVEFSFSKSIANKLVVLYLLSKVLDEVVSIEYKWFLVTNFYRLTK